MNDFKRNQSPTPEAFPGEDHERDVAEYGLMNNIMSSDLLPEARKRMPINEAAVANAASILNEYKVGKRYFDAHIVSDEAWWRLRHWDELNARDGETNSEAERGEIDPKSAWLFNSVVNKHADFMDAVPTFAVLPREAQDEGAARLLSQIIPVILEQNKFERIYHAAVYNKIMHGTGIYGVFWDNEKRGGLGDIVLKSIDPLRLFWEGGIDDIQDSANVFYVSTMNREAAKRAYPEIADRLESAATSAIVEDYRGDDYVNKSDKVEIVDWYYKTAGRLHLCKFCAGAVIYATENSPEVYPDGLYKHGMYPFFPDVLFPVKESVGGFGLIDVGKSDQEQIDRMGRGLINNVLGSSRGKTFIGQGLGVNDEDLADPKKEIIKFAGSISDANFRNVQPSSNADSYIAAINHKVQELQETTGNNDVASGNVPSGVTAASAIAALQEQAGKTSRDAIRATYRTFSDVVLCIIELIREFYDLPRTFRITGEGGKNDYVTFSKAEMAPMQISKANGELVNVDPIYDVKVSAQKASPYSAMAQNEFALQLYNASFFDPTRADTAMAAIELMDFKDKDKVISIISQNRTLYQTVMELTERLNAAEAMLGVRGAAPAVNTPGVPRAVADAKMPEQNAEGVVTEEPKITKKARERSAESTIPR